jgi:hypothetical protein
MAAELFFNPRIGTDFNPGDKLYFYVTGTSTALTVYSNSALSSVLTQPVVADADGKFVPIYLNTATGSAKVVLKTAADVERWTVDPYVITDIATLQAQIDDVEADTDALLGRMSDAEAEIDTLQAESTDYESRIAALEATELPADVSALVPVAMGSVTGGSSPAFQQRYGFGATITQVSTGIRRLAFSAARPNASYIVQITAGPATASSPLTVLWNNKTTSGFDVETWYTTGGGTNSYQNRDFDVVVFAAP